MLLKVPIIYFNCDITSVISTVWNIWCVIKKVSNSPFQMLTEFAGTQGTSYDSSERGLLVKISLKSILTSFPRVPPSGDKAIPSCPAPPHILCLIPSRHQAGQILCKRKADYLCFAGLADDEGESSLHPASSEPREGLGGVGGRCYQHPRLQWGWPRGPHLHGCIVASPGPANQLFPWVVFPAMCWCALSLTKSQTSSLGLGFTGCHF